MSPRSHRNCQAPKGKGEEQSLAQGKTMPSFLFKNQSKAPENDLVGRGPRAKPNRLNGGLSPRAL